MKLRFWAGWQVVWWVQGRIQSGVVGTRPLPPPQIRIPVLALQAWRASKFLAAQCSEGPGQFVERAAQDPHGVRMAQVRGQGLADLP